jgi:hypothetical protein
MSGAAAAGAAGGLGGIFSALGAITQGEGQALSATASGEASAYQAQVARNNAIIAGYNATEAEQAGEQQAFATSMQGAQTMGRIKTAQAANNVDVNSGSAKDVQIGAREVEQLNTETVMSNAELQSYGYRRQAATFSDQATLEQMAANEAPTEASLAEEGATFSAAAGLLGSASSVGFKFAGLGTQPAGTTNNPTLAGSLY